jgi:hypothetical protein
LRTAQYAFILAAQVVLLCVMFTVGAHVIDLSPHRVPTTNTAQAPAAPSGEGLDGLRDYLSR